MSEGIEINVPFPAVQVELLPEGDSIPEAWLDMPTVPLPGDTIKNGGVTWVVLRREFDVEYPSTINRVAVVVRKSA